MTNEQKKQLDVIKHHLKYAAIESNREKANRFIIKCHELVDDLLGSS